MLPSVRALLSGIIDYAGMFPPAKLPLDQAIRKYARYRTEPESWMLGRFICPAARLSELEPYLPELFSPERPLSISGLGQGGNSISEFVTRLRADLEMLANFQKKSQGSAVVEILEARLPNDVVDVKSLKSQIPKISQLNRQICQIMDSAACHTLPIFLEIPLRQNWRQTLAWITPILWQAIVMGAQGNTNPGRNRSGGVKIRCGGMEPAAFPTPEEIAGAIAICQERLVSLKATAGLHHPIRHFNAELKTVMHGFLNVFVAGVLTFANRRTEKEVQVIIEDEDPKNFVFDDDGLRWKTYRAKTAQIETARREFITSFGSCSFDEPRDDLRALGLI